MKTITYDWIRRHGACEDERNLAALHFGRSAPLTRATLLEAAALDLDMDWLASRLLTPSQFATYDARPTSLLWGTYEVGRAPLLADALGLP